MTAIKNIKDDLDNLVKKKLIDISYVREATIENGKLMKEIIIENGIKSKTEYDFDSDGKVILSTTIGVPDYDGKIVSLKNAKTVYTAKTESMYDEKDRLIQVKAYSDDILAFITKISYMGEDDNLTTITERNKVLPDGNYLPAQHSIVSPTVYENTTYDMLGALSLYSYQDIEEGSSIEIRGYEIKNLVYSSPDISFKSIRSIESGKYNIDDCKYTDGDTTIEIFTYPDSTISLTITKMNNNLKESEYHYDIVNRDAINDIRSSIYELIKHRISDTDRLHLDKFVDWNKCC